MNGSIEVGAAGHEPLGPDDSARASRRGWTDLAPAYQAAHAAALGDVSLLWGPEGLREEQAGLLGDLTGADVLDVGCGGGQSTRWLAGRGARAVGVDLAEGMLAHARATDSRSRLVQADARRLPFAARSFDVACSAYGALSFVADPASVHRELARVLRPGGLWVWSVTHPVRWAFSDDPGERGLTVVRSYFDRTPYVERDRDGQPAYVEHHRTLGDHVRDVVGAGFRLVDIVEPEWPVGRTESWDGWSALRGAVLPGTAIFVCRLQPLREIDIATDHETRHETGRGPARQPAG